MGDTEYYAEMIINDLEQSDDISLQTKHLLRSLSEGVMYVIVYFLIQKSSLYRRWLMSKMRASDPDITFVPVPEGIQYSIELLYH